VIKSEEPLPVAPEADLSGALRLPYAHGGPVGSGALRMSPEDFVVREWLGFEADGEGDHWLLTVRKRGANTHWVAKQLAKLANVHPRDVGFAGLKDRNALTEQAFTVPVRSPIADWVRVAGDGFEVIGAQRHRRKLKRGALRGNDFEIMIRGFSGERSSLDARLATIAARGVPNYFGPQRFGHELGNLKRAFAMFAGDLRIDDRFERGFALSAARAHVFNAVLAQRVEMGTWDTVLEGEVVNLDGSQSIFVPETVDAALIDRCERLDIHPTGPLWGRGELQSRALPDAGAASHSAFGLSVSSARTLEEAVAARHVVLCEGLARAGLEQERRALRLRVQALSHEWYGEDLMLRFRLTRGAFATTVLHELLTDAFAIATPESEE